jgi:hypothetical protein
MRLSVMSRAHCNLGSEGNDSESPGDMVNSACRQNGKFIRISFAWRTSVTASSAGTAMAISQNGNTDEVG